MSEIDFLDALHIAPRLSSYCGEWVPVYLEPLPGSGERICIGIVATDRITVRTLPVARLDRLQCAYGIAARSISWSAQLVMSEVKAVVEAEGIERLSDSIGGIEGASVGDRRVGVGCDLDDLATLALRQASTLTATESEQPVALTPHIPTERASPIVKAVQRAVLMLRPALRDSFGQQFSLSDSDRPTVYGFVGQRIVANFATLGGASADRLGSQVDRAKARLWDLEQLQQGVLRDVFGTPMRTCSFALLACPPPEIAKFAVPKRAMSPGLLNEAVQTLEREADKFDIRWRFLRNPQEIAGMILEREAA